MCIFCVASAPIVKWPSRKTCDARDGQSVIGYNILYVLSPSLLWNSWIFNISLNTSYGNRMLYFTVLPWVSRMSAKFCLPGHRFCRAVHISLHLHSKSQHLLGKWITYFSSSVSTMFINEGCGALCFWTLFFVWKKHACNRVSGIMISLCNSSIWLFSISSSQLLVRWT